MAVFIYYIATSFIVWFYSTEPYIRRTVFVPETLLVDTSDITLIWSYQKMERGGVSNGRIISVEDVAYEKKPGTHAFHIINAKSWF